MQQLKFADLLRMQTIAPGIFFLCGADPYLQAEAAKFIKSRFAQNEHCDQRRISMESAEDWQFLLEQMQNFSLFAEKSLFDMRYEKKSFDNKAKSSLLACLEQEFDHCLLLVQAPEFSEKQLAFLNKEKQVYCINLVSLKPDALAQWVRKKLAETDLQIEPQLVEQIVRYTEGNQLAAAQLIERLNLVYAKGTKITLNDLEPHLENQSQYTLYQFAEQALQGNFQAALAILRQSLNKPSDLPLILWMLSQDIQLLMELQYHMQQGQHFASVAKELRIWPQKQRYYQQALKRLAVEKLQQLIQDCQALDQGFKTGVETKADLAVERILQQYTQPA